MTEELPAAAPRRSPRVLAMLGVAVLVLAVALYAARKVIAREAILTWLRSRGVAAAAEVQGLDLSGATAALRIGDPRAPDLSVERVELGYGLRGLRLEVRSVRLVRPLVRARLHAGRLSVGALDPIIEEFRRRPPQPGAVQPRVTVEKGLLLLGTDYGPVRLDADAQVEGGKLIRLAAASTPTRLRGRGFDLSLGAGTLGLQTRGERVELALDAPIQSATAGAVAATDARLRLTAAVPYPDLPRRRVDGAVTAHANLVGERLAVAGQALADAQLAASFTGRAAGWIPDLLVSGRGVADLRAGSGIVGGARAQAVRAAVIADDLRWSRQGGDAVAARLTATAAVDAVTAGDLELQRVTLAARGPIAAGAQGFGLDLADSALGHGAWPGMGLLSAEDSREIAAVKRAARGFRFAAPGLALRSAGGEMGLALSAPVRLMADAGGQVVLAPRGAGAYRLTGSGGGLPRIDAGIDRVRLAGGTLAARVDGKAALSIGPVQDGVFDVAGALQIASGAVTFHGERCATLAASRLELGANDVSGLAGRLCPTGAPLLTLAHGDWRVAGRAEGVSAEIPFLQAKVAQAAGPIDLGQTGGQLQAAVALAGAEVADAAPSPRFHPLRISGRAGLAHDLWTAELGIADPAGRPLGHAVLRHQAAGGRGGVDFDTGLLSFAEGGLQPAQLSPLAAAIGSPVEGHARFTGGFAWTPAGATSGGVLEVPRLDFQSQAGRVTGLSGRVVFSSLSPLVTAPGGALKAEAVASPIAPLTDLAATLAVDAEALHVSGGRAAVGGGVVRVASLDVPLTAGAPARGVLDLEGVQLHDLVEASPFGGHVDLDARVSGRLPFEISGQKVRVTGGSLHAVQPGRLSIQRSALTGVAASGEAAAPAAAAEPPTDTFTDFAYQAMENLAFDKLDAAVDSQPGGRLGVVFHVVGRHDPPQHQEIRLSLFDLIGRKFLGRKLPLPSGTGVDLTLDTTLNLDDLLSDFAEYQRLRSSPPVQP